MAVLDKVIEENQGLLKEPDKDSIGILLDIVQKDIYVYPIESSIRENFSNAFDSIKERKIALSILSKETKVSDHFVEDTRIETRASIFDENYYDAKYLDKGNNKVTISYIVNEENGKDVLYFKDKGVGLGGKRLEGYMRPGYSSKRLSKGMLGKYGLGSKSALATNIEYYVLESWYNGYYTKFMIYDAYYKCIVSKKDANKTEYFIGRKEIINDEGEVEIVTVKEPIYWQKTKELNGVTLSFNVKSHNKDRFTEAVKKQLMYFGDNLVFEIIEDGLSYEPSFKAHILHETDLFIVSNNSYFTVPHILINNVNYNTIDFPELGMNKLYGSVAVKATSSDIDITASRESVKWTEKTRSFIQKAISAASNAAGDILEEKLVSIENPVERYLAATNYQSRDDDAELIKQLRNFGGSVRLTVNVKPTDYLSTETLKDLGFKSKVPMVSVYNMLEGFHRFKTSVIDASSSNVSIAELSNYASLNFNSLYFVHHEDNSYNMRISMALYIKRKLREDTHGSYQFMTFKDFTEKPLELKEFISTTKLKQTDIKKNRHISLYKSYVDTFKRKRLSYAVFIAVIKKYATDMKAIPEKDIKDFAKSINLAEDPVLRQTLEQKKNGNRVSVHVSTISEAQTKKDTLVQLKKEKQVLTYRYMHMSKFINGSKNLSNLTYETNYSFVLGNIKTAELPDIQSTVIYAATADRELLKAVAYMHILSIKEHRHMSRLKGTVDDTAFIQIAKDNIKFFKEIPGSMDVKEYIKEEHSVDNGKLHIRFGNTVNKFVTGIYLHRLVVLNKINESLSSSRYINILSKHVGIDNIKNIEKAYSMLAKFPLPRGVDGVDDPMPLIKDNFKQVLDNSTESINELLDSLYKLSEIQNLPVDGLQDDQKSIVKKFNEVDVDVFDKVFIDDLEQDLLKYREVMELVFIKYLILEVSTNYDKKRAIEIIEAQIEEKLVSL